MLWGRKFALEVQIEKNVKKYETKLTGDSILRVDFNINKTIGGIGETADITIYGLTLEDIRFLCTAITLRGKNPPPRNYVSISAGYEEDYGVIFQGGIKNVVPNVDNSDMSVQLSCVSGYTDNRTAGMFQFSKEGKVSYGEIASKIADFFSVPINNKSTKAASAMISNPHFNCTGLVAINQLRDMKYGDIDIFMTGGVLMVQDMGKSFEKPIFLTGTSGLIGTPQPTPYGAEITCLLRPSLQAGYTVKVESKKLTMTTGLYRIINMTHTGSSRGDEFYTKISGEKVQV